MDSPGQAPSTDAAATVILLRDSADGPEVLLLERPRHTGSFAGAWVFPGGKVDPEDVPAADDAGDGPARTLEAARNAGVRETAEEAGLRLDPEDLVHLSIWVPRHSLVRRFQTWFFLAAAPDGPVVLNTEELGDYAWLTPRAALARHAAGGMQLVPPTWVTLHLLQEFSTVEDALAAARRNPPTDFQSHLLDDPQERVIVWSGDSEYEGPGPAAAEGSRHRLTMSTLPWVYQRT